jgi:hypothetical protein
VGTPRFNRRRGPTASRGKTIGGTVTLIGGLLTGLGTIVPIYSAVDTTYFKLNSDEGFSRGVWVAAAGIAIAFLAAFGILKRQSTRIPTVCALGLSVAVLFYVLHDYHRFEGLVDLDLTSGIVLCLIGAIASGVGSVVALVAQSA